jgi:hypothetical protein
MTAPNHRQQWLELKNTSRDPLQIGRLANRVAASFLDGFLSSGSYSEGHIALLCEMSTAEGEPELTQPAVRALFGIIVERLCDEFEALPAEFYNRVMAQVISFCRKLPAGHSLDLALTAAGMDTGDDIVERAARVAETENHLSIDQPPRKIFVLSRVTIGADVAVTSVILQRLQAIFPHAEMILVGSHQCEEIFGGCERLQFAPVTYKRRGGIYERLESWHKTREIISGHMKAGSEGDVIIVDPDSRLSQLGLLPMASEDCYFYFHSRSADAAPERLSIGALTNSWLDKISGQTAFSYPCLWLPGRHQTAAAAFCRQLHEHGARRLIAVNFGVGGNPRKRVGRRFELNLLLQLLAEPGTVVLLDSGIGQEESDNSSWLMESLRKRGYLVQTAEFGAPPSDRPGSRLLGIQLDIGQLAALVEVCDEYIGYDSAGQHIAAALKVPCVTVFAGSNSMRFIQRWAALGQGRRHIVHVDTLTDPDAVDIEDVIGRIMATRGSA